MEVYTKTNEKIIIKDDALASGGEGEVHLITSSLPKYKNSCVKIYYQQKRTPKLESKILFMTKNPPKEIISDRYMLGWPQDIVYDSARNFIGFIMPLAFSNSRELAYLTTPKVSAKLEQVWHNKYSLDPKYSLEQRQYALLSRLKLLHNIAIPIHLLHNTGKYVLQDFKPQNVLVTHDGKVSIVDMDSIQITDNGKLLFPGTGLTNLYIPTEFHTLGVGKKQNIPIKWSWDYFALGVVFYQILFGLHPYVVTPKNLGDADNNDISQNIASDLFPFGYNRDQIQSYPPLHNKFSAFPEEVQRLFRRCFTANPEQRPSAEDWGKEIHKILKQIGNIPAPTTIPPVPPIPKPRPIPPSPTPTEVLVCPECGCKSDSIKRYELPHLYVFLGVYLYYQNIEYTCCPHCMRKHIFVKGFTYNIITANIFWLFFLLPWSIVQFLRSLTKGHSKEVKKDLGIQ